jgi:anthranilate synthase
MKNPPATGMAVPWARSASTATRLKASALLDAVRGHDPARRAPDPLDLRLQSLQRSAAGLRVLMVDHQDSFVHNLAAYLRQCGVTLSTLRPAAARDHLHRHGVDLVVLSPGPR